MTLYLLTPVSVKPEKEGWYWIQTKWNGQYNHNSAHYQDCRWRDYLNAGDTELVEIFNVTHWLRPIEEETIRKVLTDLFSGGSRTGTSCINEYIGYDNELHDEMKESYVTNALKTIYGK